MAPAQPPLRRGQHCQDADLDEAMNTIVDNGARPDHQQLLRRARASRAAPTESAAEHQTFLQAAAEGIGVLFSSGDNGDELAATGTRAGRLPGLRPAGHRGRRHGLAVAKATATASRGLGHRQVRARPDGAWSAAARALPLRRWRRHQPAVRPARYQKGVVPASIANYFGQGPHRAVPDVAMVGDPNTGLLVGQTPDLPRRHVTTASTASAAPACPRPLFAGLVAVADQVAGGPLGLRQPAALRLAGTPAFRDVDHGRKVTTGVVRVDFVNGVDDKAGLTTRCARWTRRARSLHPQGLRRRHRHRHPQRRELLHRGRGRADAPLTPTASRTGSAHRRVRDDEDRAARAEQVGAGHAHHGHPVAAVQRPRRRAGEDEATVRRLQDDALGPQPLDHLTGHRDLLMQRQRAGGHGRGGLPPGGRRGGPDGVGVAAVGVGLAAPPVAVPPGVPPPQAPRPTTSASPPARVRAAVRARTARTRVGRTQRDSVGMPL